MIRKPSEAAPTVAPWVIRRARRSDTNALLAYFAALAAETPNNTSIRRNTVSLTAEAVLDRITRYERNPHSVLYLAVHAGSVIGIVSLTGDDSPFTAHQVELSINVHSNWRGRGLGSALMQTALAWARSQPHVERIQLEALTRNTTAVRLYQRCGFVIEGVRRSAYHLVDEPGDAQAVDAIHMAYLVRRGPDGRVRETQQRSRWQEG